MSTARVSRVKTLTKHEREHVFHSPGWIEGRNLSQEVSQAHEAGIFWIYKAGRQVKTMPIALPDSKTMDTRGFAIRASGTTLNLKIKGDKTTLKNVYLLMSYKGGLR